MKPTFFVTLLLAILLTACDKVENGSGSLKGNQSALGKAGTTATGGNITLAGITGISGSVTSFKDGVSDIRVSANISNATYKSLLTNHPLIESSGNQITLTGLKVKTTDEGIEMLNSNNPGILVKYDAKVGDKYPIEGTKKFREVTACSTDNDYSWDNMKIKVIEVTLKLNGPNVERFITYSNHKFGIVGIKVILKDGKEILCPIFASSQN